MTGKIDKPRDKRVPIMLTEDELKQIDEWRFLNKVGTRADAMRTLIKRGIEPQSVAPTTSWSNVIYGNGTWPIWSPTDE